jgi:hypothetical protein
MENLLTKLDLKDKQAHLWNWDEAGLMYAMKYNKTMGQLGRKYVYKQSCREGCHHNFAVLHICLRNEHPTHGFLQGVRVSG